MTCRTGRKPVRVICYENLLCYRILEPRPLSQSAQPTRSPPRCLLPSPKNLSPNERVERPKSRLVSNVSTSMTRQLPTVTTPHARPANKVLRRCSMGRRQPDYKGFVMGRQAERRHRGTATTATEREMATRVRVWKLDERYSMWQPRQVGAQAKAGYKRAPRRQSRRRRQQRMREPP